MGVSPMRAAATGLQTSMIAAARSIGPMRAAAGLSAFRTISPMRAAAGLSAVRMASPMRAAAGLSATSMIGAPRAGLTATTMIGAPRGVDLDLGRFDVSTPTRLTDEGVSPHWQMNVALGHKFWESLEKCSK